MGKNLAGNDYVADADLVVHAAGDTGIDNCCRLECVDQCLRAEGSVDLCDAAANMDNAGVAYLIDIVVKASFFLNFRIRQTVANVCQFRRA